MPEPGYPSTLTAIARELRICFLLPGLGRSGGVRAAVTHAVGLEASHGMKATLVVAGPVGESQTDGVRTIPLSQARQERFDIAVATWWHTVHALFDVGAERRAYFLQSFEDRLYHPGDVERLGAAITHALPVSFITEARWIADLLADLRPDAPCVHVPNGVDKELFSSPPEPPARPAESPLRVLLEGSQNLWYKGIDSAVAATQRMTAPRDVTLVTPEPPTAALAVDRALGPLALEEMPALYSQTDVLLKLSRVEGVFTPPIEAFHLGATCVVSPVTGHDEYVVHGRNGVVAEWDDLPGTARWLDLLAQDRGMLQRLRTGALETANAWPSWEQATAVMAGALRDIAAAPAPPVEHAIAQLLADARAGLEELRWAQFRTEREIIDRDTEIARLRRRQRELRASPAYRLGARLLRPLQVARRARRSRP